MKKVVLLYSKNLTDPTGASAVIRILNDIFLYFNKITFIYRSIPEIGLCKQIRWKNLIAG